MQCSRRQTSQRTGIHLKIWHTCCPFISAAGIYFWNFLPFKNVSSWGKSINSALLLFHWYRVSMFIDRVSARTNHDRGGVFHIFNRYSNINWISIVFKCSSSAGNNLLRQRHSKFTLSELHEGADSLPPSAHPEACDQHCCSANYNVQ